MRWKAPSCGHRQPGRRHQRRRAPWLQPPDNTARLGRGRPTFTAQEHQDQHPAVIFTRSCPATPWTSTVAAKGGDQEQVQDVHAQPGDNGGGLGAQRPCHHGRWLVPPGMLGIGIGSTAERHVAAWPKPDGRPGHVRSCKPKQASGADSTMSESCAWSCLKGQRPGHWRPRPGRP